MVPIVGANDYDRQLRKSDAWLVSSRHVSALQIAKSSQCYLVEKNCLDS